MSCAPWLCEPDILIQRLGLQDDQSIRVISSAIIYARSFH